jgi:anaerobic selenocysteine-containing dehydrogenase
MISSAPAPRRSQLRGSTRASAAQKPRGVLVQIEPKMTLTGANADRWIVIAPGTEGVFALGLARELLQRKDFAGNLSPALPRRSNPTPRPRSAASPGCAAI